MKSFSELINSAQPVLVDFYADWCGPCKLMTPILKEVASKVEGAKIIKVDVDRSAAVVAKYDVRAVPTLILFKKGEIKWRQSGVVQSNLLIEIINGYLN